MRLDEETQNLILNMAAMLVQHGYEGFARQGLENFELSDQAVVTVIDRVRDYFGLDSTHVEIEQSGGQIFTYTA